MKWYQAALLSVLGAGAVAGSGKAVYDAGVRDTERKVAAEREAREASIDALARKLDSERTARLSREAREQELQRAQEAYRASLAERKQLASDATYIIKNDVTYDLVYQERNVETGEWETVAEYKNQSFSGRGNGVGVYKDGGKLYVISDAHLLMQEETEYHPLFRDSLRRIWKPTKQEVYLVTGTHRDGSEISLPGLPLETLAADKEDHVLFATLPCPDCGDDAADLAVVKGIGKSADLTPGDSIYSVSRLVNNAVEIPGVLKLDDLVVEYLRQGIVESNGDPTSTSDDTIQFVKFDAQPGMSGSGVYNERWELIGLTAYGLHNNGDATRTIEGMRAFLEKHGYGFVLGEH